jgi:hypothetical protein
MDCTQLDMGGQTMVHNIAIVDDEEQILKSLK